MKTKKRKVIAYKSKEQKKAFCTWINSDEFLNSFWLDLKIIFKKL